MCGFPRSPWTSRETNAASKTLDLAIGVLVYNPYDRFRESDGMKPTNLETARSGTGTGIYYVQFVGDSKTLGPEP